MRRALFAGLVVACSPAIGLAQSGPYITTVTDPEVKLRAGPSDSFPETATLAKGAQLLVDHDEPNGWLAVQDVPGAGHSMSWVQAQFVDFDNNKPTPQRVVVWEATTLRAGQMGLAQPLNIGRTEVPAGTVLRVIGAKVQFMGKTWHPVEPPAGDFRYVPKHAVKFEKAVNNTFTVRDATPAAQPVSPASGAGPALSIPGSGSTTLPAVAVGKTGSVNHPLWMQAETAERDGKFDEAEKLYFKLAGLMNEPGGDHDIANLCYTRIHTLREKKRSGTSSTTGSRPPASEPARPVGGTLPPAAAPGDERPRWSGPGRLTRSTIALDGRKTYLLEMTAGSPGVYVVPAPGVDLERWVGKRADVLGHTHTRAGLSKPYIVATAIETPQ